MTRTPAPRSMRLALAAAAALLPLLMAGCTVNYYNNYPAPADAANPLVLVRDGRVSVNAEPLYFSQKDGAVTITWRLPAGGPYSFADNGIVVDAARGDASRGDASRGDAKQAAAPAEEFQCKKLGPTEFACLNRNSRPGVYKYTVRVNEGGKALKPLDPIIANEW